MTALQPGDIYLKCIREGGPCAEYVLYLQDGLRLLITAVISRVHQGVGGVRLALGPARSGSLLDPGAMLVNATTGLGVGPMQTTGSMNMPRAV